MFDDLIPKQPGGLSFDDLIPQAAPRPSMLERIRTGAGNAARAADDVARLIASGATLGFADKFASAAGGTSLEDERAKTKAARDRAGVAGMVAEAGGSLAPAAPIVRGVGAIAGAIPTVTRGLVAAPGAYTRAGAVGATLGAGAALGNDTDIATGAAIGAGAGVVGQGAANAIMGGVNRAAGIFNRKPEIPTLDSLKAAAQSAYKASDDAGVIVRPDAVNTLRKRVETTLADESWTPEASPQILGFLRGLGRADGENVTLKGLDKLRSNLQSATIEGGDNTRRIGRLVVGEVDDFLSSVKPNDILTGNPKVGMEALEKARELWTRQAKGNKVAEAFGAADLRAASTGSGGNLDNATRQNLRRVLEKGRNWTPDERQALIDVVRGTPGQNTLRLVGKLSPSGNGLMAALGLGATVANPAMVAAPLAGMVAKSAADRMTQANVKKLADIIAVGGSRTAAFGTPNAVQRLTQSERERLARLLMGIGVTSGVPALSQ